MPGPWVAISAAIVLTPAQGVPASSQGGVRQVYGDLVVEARSATFTEEVVTFREGVRATFAGEILTADSLVLRPKEQTGEAKGHVVLLDPAGSLSAENLSFSWKPGASGGSATNVHLELAGVMMTAEKAESVPGEEQVFIFTNVVGTSCGGEKTPFYSIHSPQVVFRPGKEGIIRRPVLYLFGRRITNLPTHRFNLDPRIKGIPMPGVAISQDTIGVQWNPSFMIDKNTTATVNVRSFEGELMRASAYATRSFLQEQDINNLVSPRSELTERFNSSYFNNIRVQTPEKGVNNIRAKRENLSVGSEWNRGSINDETNSRYSKLLEVVYEKGGAMSNDLGYQVSLRGQNIRQDDDPFETRMIAQGTLGTRPYPLGLNLFAVGRVDAASYLGTKTSGWARAEAGIYFHPKKWLRLSAGFAHGQEFGDPLFPSDQLLIRDQGMARLDLDLGPTQFSLLQKRDFDRDRWYREYSVRQIMGCFEAFVISRQFPNAYHVGVKLRLEEFLDILKKRRVQFGGTQTPSSNGTQPPPMNHAIQP